jgi:hypothetical protein
LPESVPHHDPELRKRRSTRIVQAVPLTVTGVDALGRSFQERTSTLIINCHGCRYQSKHYVLKNMWVTVEVPNTEAGREPRAARGRVTWIQRPRTVRELFQVGVELEFPGNIWGIAFPPPDWFPSSEPGAPTIPLPGSIPANAEGEVEAGEAEASNVVVMGGAEAQTPAEAPMHLARQVSRLVSEAKQQIQAAVREATARTVTQEIHHLLSSVESQLQDAAAKAVHSAADDYAKHWLARATERIELQSRASAESLREEWNKELDARLEDARTLLAAHVSSVEQAEKENFQAALGASVDSAIDRLRASAEASADRADQAREQFEHSRQELHAAVKEATHHWEQALSGRTTGAAAEMEKLQAAATKLSNQIHGAIEQGEHTWRTRLESDMEAAQKRATELAAGAVDQAVNAATAQIAAQSETETERLHAQTVKYVAALRQHTEELQAQARQSVKDFHEQWEAEAANGRAALSEIEQAAGRLTEFAHQLDGMQQATAASLERRMGELLENSTRELTARTESAVSGMAERLQPLLDAAGAQSVASLGQQLEKELAPQIDRAREMVQRLVAGHLSAEDALQSQEERMREAAAVMESEAAARLQENAARIGSEWQESSKAAMAKWQEELDARATDITHSTIESLFKSANWYEKKVQTQMQSTLESGLEQAGEALRARAGEMSGLFASELDHYSRSYVEHSQGQLEEISKEAMQQTQEKIREATETGSTEVGTKARRAAQSELERFNAGLHNAFDQSAASFEAHSVQIRARMGTESRQFLADFQKNLTQRTQESVAAAQKELNAQAAVLRDAARAEREAQERSHAESIARQNDAAMDAYAGRLENASNAWLLTTAAKLGEQADQQIEILSKNAEEKLRETFSQVFASIGDSLRQRMMDFSSSIPIASAEKPEEK